MIAAAAVMTRPVSAMPSATAADADLGRRPDAEPLGLLDQLAAGGDLQSGDVQRSDLIKQPRARAGREHAGVLVVVDRGERGHAIPRDLDGAVRRVRADHLGDVRKCPHPREHRRDRSTNRRSVDRAMRDVKHDRVDVTALGPEFLPQQVAGALGLGPGQGEVRGIAVADRARHHGGEDRDHDQAATTKRRWPMHKRARRSMAVCWCIYCLPCIRTGESVATTVSSARLGRIGEAASEVAGVLAGRRAGLDSQAVVG